MPRYYFDLHECGEIVEDAEGYEVDDAGAAREIAMKSARAIMMAEVADGRLCLSCHIVVRDANRAAILEVPFRDAIQLSGL
jgi:uncharacterized protein DUF6894